MKPVVVSIITLLTGVVGFFGGMKYSEIQRASVRFGAMGQNQLRGTFRPTVGEIVKLDKDSFTVKIQDGSTKIVFYSDKTVYTKTTNTTREDLKRGDRIGVFGSENSDGSVSAQNIQLNPQFRVGVRSNP